MRLAVSNIAWRADEDGPVADLLLGRGVDALEVAPGRLFADPAAATLSKAAAVRREWRARGFDLVAMQALLFGRAELHLFGDEAETEAFSSYLAHVIRLAGALGCGPLVFGSPKNRLRGDLAPEPALERAADVLRPLAQLAHAEGCTLTLEPNAAAYGCDFVQRVGEAARLARLVDDPGCGVQLDAGVFALEADDAADLREAVPLVAHFHASAPHLEHVDSNLPTIRRLAADLDEAGYDGMVSIEMRAGEDNVERVGRALDALRDVRDAPA